MLNLSTEGGTHVLKLSKLMYTKQSLEEAIDAFSGECEISFTEDTESFHVRIPANPEGIEMEFCNALILLSKNRGEQ